MWGGSSKGKQAVLEVCLLVHGVNLVIAFTVPADPVT